MKMLTTPPLADEAFATPTADPLRRTSSHPSTISTPIPDGDFAARREEFRQMLDRLPTDRLRDFVAVARAITRSPAPGNRTGLRADRRALAAAFPACFNRPKSKAPKRPLKIGITADLIARGVTGEDGQPLSRKRIERAVRWAAPWRP